MQINSLGFLDSRLDMAKAAKIMVEFCADVKPGENVIITSDDAQSRNVYMSLTAAAATAGAEASLLLYPTPKPEIFGNRIPLPKALKSVLRDADVVFLCGMRTPSFEVYQMVEGEGHVSNARVMMMEGMTEESIIRTIPVDYAAINKKTSELIEVFNRTHLVHVTCPKGTDVTFDITGAQSVGADGTFKKLDYPVSVPHPTVAFLPAGRIGTVASAGGDPLKVNGVIKLKSFLGLGVTYGVISLTIKDSKVTEVNGEGAEQWYVETLRRLLFQDDYSRVAVEIGIGLNPDARLTGCYEDYGLQGAARFGFGETFGHGITLRKGSSFHSDGFTLGVTMELDGKALIKDGEFV